MFRLFCFDVRDLFYTFSIRKAPPLRRGGGRGGLTRYRNPPGVQRPFHISVV